MRELSNCSGPWEGYWIQGRVRGYMELGLAFDEGRIDGVGTDQIGPFVLSGLYGGESVSLMKDYATHRVGYEGIWDGTMIAGSWAMTYEEDIFDAGLFEIWPRAESREQTLEELTRESAWSG